MADIDPASQRLCVFCGSHHGRSARFADSARAVGQILVERGLGLVYGGGHVGLMGVVADTVLAAGGEVHGVIPHRLDRLEVAHQGLTELHRVRDMAERKAVMADLSTGYLTLPGGMGTLDELFEALTATQLKIDVKACGVLNVDGYFDPLLAFLDRAQEQGFLPIEHRHLLIADDNAGRLVDKVLEWRPQPGAKNV